MSLPGDPSPDDQTARLLRAQLAEAQAAAAFFTAIARTRRRGPAAARAREEAERARRRAKRAADALRREAARPSLAAGFGAAAAELGGAVASFIPGGEARWERAARQMILQAREERANALSALGRDDLVDRSTEPAPAGGDHTDPAVRAVSLLGRFARAVTERI